MNKLEQQVLFDLLQSPPTSLFNSMEYILEKCKYKNIIKSENHYLFAEGTLPVILVAHLDTVFTRLPQELFYDKEKQVLWCPFGAGFDDRAGVFAIFQFLMKGYRPSILFTLGEEEGGYGAFIAADEIKPSKDIKYVIELDRRGHYDCVFYEEENEEFKDYIKSYGFIEAQGIFTDICVLAPEWKLPCVNLSIGYLDEHTYSERLYIRWFEETVDKVRSMLNDCMKAPFFKSELADFGYCDKCNKPIYRYDDGIFVEKDNKILYYCSDCYNKYHKELKGLNKSKDISALIEDKNWDWGYDNNDGFYA